MIPILGLDYYWGAGGGGGTYDSAAGDGGLGGGGGGGVNMPVSSGVVADIVGRGGLGGVGKATNGNGTLNSDATGGNGANHTGSGGGGAGWTSGQGGSGGSGIIIIKLKSIVPIDTHLPCITTHRANATSPRASHRKQSEHRAARRPHL